MSNFIDDNLPLPNGKTNATAVPAGQEAEYVADNEWDNICSYLDDLRTRIQEIGWRGAWSAGTYRQAAVVSRGPFLFGANSANTIDPCFDFGALDNSTNWAFNGCHDQSNGYSTLISGSTSTAANMIYKTNETGWDKRRLIADLSLSGSADAMQFGIFDGGSSAVQTGSLNGLTGAWGVELDIFNGKLWTIVNGVQGNQVLVNSGAINTTSTGIFDRWYLDLVDNGSGAGTMTMTLYRNWTTGVTEPFSGISGPNADGIYKWATWTVTRPTFTDWKYAIGARTGGSAGTFAAKRAYARYTGSEWTVIGLVPDRA